MLINFSHLKNLPVFTQSGLFLGRIVDLEIDADSQSIINYLVQRGRLVGRWQKPLLIHRQQVISISKEKMIVEDAIAKQLETVKAEKEIAPQTAASGVSARQLDN